MQTEASELVVFRELALEAVQDAAIAVSRSFSLDGFNHVASTVVIRTLKFEESEPVISVALQLTNDLQTWITTPSTDLANDSGSYGVDMGSSLGFAHGRIRVVVTDGAGMGTTIRMTACVTVSLTTQ